MGSRWSKDNLFLWSFPLQICNVWKGFYGGLKMKVQFMTYQNFILVFFQSNKSYTAWELFDI